MGIYGVDAYGSFVYGPDTDPPPPPPDPIDALADIAVEMAFGFGPGTSPDDDDWVDITEWVDLTASSVGAKTETGRDNVRTGITPGTCTFALVNRDGRFNPRNPAGPYYGDLVNGVQVRVVVTWDDVPYVRWRGFVNSGWPQQITSRDPLVMITAHDIAGLIAQGDAAETAFHAAVRSLATPPDQWWRPGTDGWIDQQSGIAATHTSQLVELDPVVDGDARSFGQVEPDGHGSIVQPAAQLDPDSADTIVLSAWVRFPDADAMALAVADLGGTDIPVVFQTAASATPGAEPASLFVNMSRRGVTVGVACPSWKTESYGYQTVSTTFDGAPAVADLGFVPGSAHHLQVAVTRPDSSGWICTPDLDDVVDGVGGTPLATGGRIRVWVNGEEVPGYGLVNLTSTALGTISPLRIGSSSVDWGVYAAPRYVGAIDHLMLWHAHPGTDTDLDEQAELLADSGRLAWAGDSMDGRLARIVQAMGLGAHLGALDASGIVTRQGYRQAGPLELLQTIEHTEQGRVWVDREGDLRFSRRTWSWDDARSTVVQVTFSDDPDLIAVGAQEMLEQGTVITDDPFDITNVAAVNSTFGRQQIVEDTDSIDVYRRRNAVQLSGLLHDSDRQSRSIAEWIVASQATPQIKARQVSFRVGDNPDVLTPLAAQIEEGWLVRIVKETEAETLDLLAHVIGVEHAWSYTGWVVTLTLDSTRTGYSFFEWGTSTWVGSDGWAF